MNPYELTVLYHPDLEIDLDKAEKKVQKILKDNGGKVTATDNWGKRKLAYTIKKEDHAIYVYYEIDLPGQSVADVEGTLNITDEVLRYLLVKPIPVFEDEENESDDKKSEKKEDKKDEKSDEPAKDKKDDEEEK